MPLPTTPIGFLSFPAHFNPTKVNEGDEPKYRAVLIFPSGADLTAMREAADRVVKEKWGNKIPKNIRSPFRDCAEKDGISGYEKGETFVSFSSKNRPAVVGPNPEFPITDENDIYAGCQVRVTYRAFAYEVSGNRGASFGFMSLQKTDDDEPFGTHSDPVSDFGVVRESSDAEGMFQ